METTLLNCFYCEFQSIYQYKIFRHVAGIHKDILEYICDYCGCQQEDPLSLAKHFIQVHGSSSKNTNSKQPLKHICDMCGKGCKNARALEYHIKNHGDDRPYQCNKCNWKFATKAQLDQHFRKHIGLRPFKCPHCERDFDRALYLDKHMKTHEGDRPHKCDICGKCFTREKQLIRHKKIHNNDRPFECDICKKTFQQTSHLSAHILTHTADKANKCHVCDQGFTQIWGLIRHITKLHPGEPVPKPVRIRKKAGEDDSPTYTRYSCNVCHNYFESISELSLHIQIHVIKVKDESTTTELHADDVKVCIKEDELYQKNENSEELELDPKYFTMLELKEEDLDPSLLTCNECDKTFTSKSKLLGHQKYHLQKKGFICQICGLVLTTTWNLKAHVRNFHTEEGIAKKQQKKKPYGENHVKIPLDEPVVCCNKTFTEKLQLHNHMQYHKNKNKGYMCPVCGLMMATMGNLKLHSRKHTDERYCCQYCSQTFRYSNSLKEHLRKHTGETPYKCTYENCTEAFGQSGAYYRHIRSHAAALEPQQGKVYTCTVCEKTFTTSYRLNGHMRIHTGKKTSKVIPEPPQGPVLFKCFECYMEFNDAIEFEEHIEGHKDKRNIFLKRKRPPLIKNVPLSELNSSISDVVEFAPINFHTAPPALMDNNDDEDDDWFPERKHLPIPVNTRQVMITKQTNIVMPVAAEPIVQKDVNKSSLKPEPSLETDLFEHQFEIVNLSEIDTKYEDFVDEAKDEEFFKSEESIEIEKDDNHDYSMEDHAFGYDDDVSDDNDENSYDGNLHEKAILNEVKEEKPEMLPLDKIKRDIVNVNKDENVKEEEEEEEEEKKIEMNLKEEKKEENKSEKKEKLVKEKKPKEPKPPRKEGEKRKYTKKKKPDNVPFVCEPCNKTFPTRQKYTTHMHYHKNKAIGFMCNLCGQILTSKCGLDKHIQYHSDEKLLKCKICDVRFKHYTSLKVHLLKHPGAISHEKRYKCQICEKKFMYSHELKKHSFVHTNERNFTCDYCGKKFKRRCHLVTHIGLHTGEGMFECDQCPKRYTLRVGLVKHKESHLKELDTTCHICHKEFVRLDFFKKHLEKHELKGETQPLSDKPPVKKKEYSCQFCHKIFLKKVLRNRHHKYHLRKAKETLKTLEDGSSPLIREDVLKDDQIHQIIPLLPPPPPPSSVPNYLTQMETFNKQVANNYLNL